MKNFKNILLCILCMTSSILSAQLPANCSADLPRMIIAGDSWAQYMYDDGTFNTTLKAYGHADKTAISQSFELGVACFDSPNVGDYSVSGSEAREWVDEINYPYLNDLINAINANSSIELVVLSIGGNDILAGKSEGGWYKDMDQDVTGSEQALFAVIESNTQYIMDQVWLRSRPDLKFIISGYDYPNFNVTAFCGSYACPKREDLSQDPNNNLITDAEINGMMLSVEEIRKAMAENDGRIFYDNSMGIGHHYFGVGAIPEGGTPEPEGVFPYAEGGDPFLPTDRDNFRGVGVFCLAGFLDADPIHLDAETYEYKIKNMYDNIVFENYRGEPDGTYFSEGINDGYVDRITGNTNSAGIRMGDEGITCCFGGADNDYYGILSFNTSDVPDDAVITAASVYLMRSGADDNPFEKGDRDPVIDIKSGFFGNLATLENNDATASADGTDIGCYHGLAENNKDAIRIDIKLEALEHINVTGQTQFRLYFDVSDWSNEYINFYDGSGQAAFAPPTESEVRFAENNYSSRIVKKTKFEDGSISEEIIFKGKPIVKKEGYVYYEKLISTTENEDNTTTEVFKMIAALEHPGLAKHMTDAFSAPGGGFAPFMDITFTSALPLELLEFKANKVGHDAHLSWRTASEINVAGMAIEHSMDGVEWSKIGYVRSEDGQEISSYTYIDKLLKSGINYYRLKIIDKDGKYEYSEMRQVTKLAGQGQYAVYPNPFSDQIKISIPIIKKQTIKIRILDFMGKTIYNKTYEAERGQFNPVIDGLHYLNSGSYILEISGDSIYREKIIKE